MGEKKEGDWLSEEKDEGKIAVDEEPLVAHLPIRSTVRRCPFDGGGGGDGGCVSDGVGVKSSGKRPFDISLLKSKGPSIERSTCELMNPKMFSTLKGSNPGTEC